jgi:hypothetical protein
MALAKGPFTVQWGSNVLEDIEELELEYEVDTEDYTTIQGRTFEVSGSHKASATVTLLATDVPSLAALLPQYHIDDNATASTGETVDDVNGIIDLVPGGCDVESVYYNLIITSCGNPGQVFRMLNVRTEIDGVELDDKIRKVSVRMIGEAPQDMATIQFFKEGALGSIS